MSTPLPNPKQPLRALDEWEEFVVRDVYPEPAVKAREDYRSFDDPARQSVREFYRLNHRGQTVDFVRGKEAQYSGLRQRTFHALEALDYLNTLIDDSDPDTDLDQMLHLLQTSEAIRQDGHPDWFVLAGLLHDLGKILCLFGEPQWAVVGDTFPVGCQFSDRIVFHEYFRENPDSLDRRYNTKYGMYWPGCGLRNVHMSWGHDEYLYRVLRDYLPPQAQYMIRYHSFYAWHREGQYDWLCDDYDREMLPWVQAFNPYDLYSKCPRMPDWPSLQPYYVKLLNSYLPPVLHF